MSEFSAEEIKYFPRVTAILSATGLSDFSQIRNSEFYLERGSDIHLICADIDRGVPDYWSDSDLSGYASAWIEFKKQTGFQPDLIEEPVVNDIRRFRGTLDRTGTFPHIKNKILLDIKSGVIAKWVALQTAAYASCLPEPESFRRFGIALAGNGKYKLTEFENYRSDSNYFFSLVATVHGRSIYGKAESWEGE